MIWRSDLDEHCTYVNAAWLTFRGGLSIFHSIIEDMNGELTLDSVEGIGTTVRITLPSAAEPIAQSCDIHIGEVAPEEPSSSTCTSVLVIDDEPAIGRVLRRVLFDHDVTAVTSAGEALKLLGSGANYHIIFSVALLLSAPSYFSRRSQTNTSKNPSTSPLSTRSSSATPQVQSYDQRTSPGTPNERL